MQSVAIRINHLLECLEEEDYNSVISYIEFLSDARRKKQAQEKELIEKEGDVESIVASLIGAIPDSGKTLEEYRNERLKKYENFD